MSGTLIVVLGRAHVHFYMNMKIFMTGTAGFIGFHTARALLERGDEVVGLDNFNSYYDPELKEARNAILEQYDTFSLYRGNLEDLDLVKRIFMENAIDKVCHLAAQAGVRYSITHPHAYIQANLVGLMNVLDEAKNAGVEHFVYASSSSVYGNNKKVPFSVDDRVDTPISLYAATKKANELMAHTYHHLYGMQCVGLRFFTVYGPWGRPDMALFTFTKNILEGKPIDVYNHGRMRRNFTYIDDIVAGTVAALDADIGYEIFNLGGSRSEELMDFIGAIEKAVGREAEKRMLPMQAGDVPETVADITRSQEILCFEPKTSITDGIPRFVNWYRGYHSI